MPPAPSLGFGQLQNPAGSCAISFQSPTGFAGPQEMKLWVPHPWHPPRRIFVPRVGEHNPHDHPLFF